MRNTLTRRFSFGFLFGIALFLSACAGILTPSQHNTLDYNNAFAAASRGDLAMVQSSLATDPSLLTRTEWQGMTLLHDAVDKGQIEVATFLIEQNADLNAQTHDGRTPLHIAAQHGNVPMIALLLKHGATLNAVDANGWTPLDRAVRWAHSDAAAYLRAQGAHA